jgi:hypothetical protein
MRLVYQLYKQGLATRGDVLDGMCEYFNLEDHEEGMDDYLGMNAEEYRRFVLYGKLDEDEEE